MLYQPRAQRSCSCRSKAPKCTWTPSLRLTSESSRWGPYPLAECVLSFRRSWCSLTVSPAEESGCGAVSYFPGGCFKESARRSEASCQRGEFMNHGGNLDYSSVITPLLYFWAELFLLVCLSCWVFVFLCVNAQKQNTSTVPSGSWCHHVVFVVLLAYCWVKVRGPMSKVHSETDKSLPSHNRTWIKRKT